MNRTLSFGYNAAASIAERVGDRLMTAPLAAGAVNEVILGSGEILPGIIASHHTLMTHPHLELVVPGSSDRVRLDLDIHTVLSYSAPFVGLANGDWIKAHIALMPQVSFQGTRLRPVWPSLKSDLTSVGSSDHIIVENVTSNNVVLQAAGASLLSEALLAAIPNSQLNTLGVDVGIDAKSLRSDAFDLAVIDGPPPLDLDEAVFGAYHGADPDSRGGRLNLGACLTPGRSVSVRISKSAFDSSVTDSLNRAFMRYDVVLGGPDEKARHISWAPGLPALNAFGKFALSILPDSARLNLRNCSVTNLRTGAKVTFSTGPDGSCHFGILSSAIPFDDLQTGDTLRFFGEYRFERNTRIYYPTLTLRDGHIEILVHVARDVLCYDMVDIDLKAKLFPALDKATGALDATVGDVNISMPWYVDAGVFLAKLGLAAITGPFESLIIGSPEEAAAGQVMSQLGAQTSLLVPSVPGNQYMRLFWEDLQVRSDGLILGGQIEAGWLRSGGRNFDPKLLAIDDMDELSVDVTSGKVRVSNFPIDGRASEFPVVVLVPPSMAFETLGIDELMQLTAGPADDALTISPASIEGRVLAARTGWGNYAKVRVDRSEQKAWVLRWITYNAPPKTSVRITGDWETDLDTFYGDRVTWTVVHKYWGSFNLSLEGFYTAEGLTCTWNYTGPGTFGESQDHRSVSVEVNADALQAPFHGVLAVEVQDLFGRKASASRDLDGTVTHKTLNVARPSLALEDLAGYLHGPGPVSGVLTRTRRVEEIETQIARLERERSRLRRS
jgi:hypothetical protein